MRLPILNKINIKHLSLYNGEINRNIEPGINMVVGGNGLGKTTFVNTIIYGLVGNTKINNFSIKTGKRELVPLINPDYFVGRIDPKDQDRAEMTLTYTVDAYNVAVTRALYRPHIAQIIVSEGKGSSPKVYDGSKKELDDTYRSIAEKIFDVEYLEDFAFVIAHLLVFSEERRTLVWDNEVQNRMIRLLFLQKEFDKKEFDRKFSKQNDLATEYDTKARHMSETRKDIRQAVDMWLQEKEKTKEKPQSEHGKQILDLEIELAKVQTSAESLNQEYIGLEERINAEIQTAKGLASEIDKSELANISLTNRLSELEQKFYSKIYQSIPPQYVLLLETLIKDGRCQVCGTSHNHLKGMGKIIKQKGQCIVCRSPVQYQSHNEGDSQNRDKLIDEINDLHSQLEQIAMKQQEYSAADKTSTQEIKHLQEIASEKIREKRHIDTRVMEIQSKLMIERAAANGNAEERDEWLEAQEKAILDLDKKIENLYAKRDQARERLRELNNQFLTMLDMVKEDLTPLFSYFASKFLGTECELVISTKSRASKPISFLFPRFYGKDRQQSTNVSESQRFFLDQAFRMALIEMFAKSTGSPTFYIAETPEGSLDLAYERNVAKMYLEFAGAGHTIVITSNLNSSNFLLSLYDGIGNEKTREKRTLDLLRHGKLSDVQKGETQGFHRRYAQLQLLPPEWPE